MIYPRCYTTGNIVAFPYNCAQGKGLTYAKLSWNTPRQPIVDWQGDTPITSGQWSSDGSVYVFPEGTVTGTVPVVDTGPSLLDRFAGGVNRVLDTSDRVTKTGAIGGYAVIALVGAGLLLWYVPRGRR